MAVRLQCQIAIIVTTLKFWVKFFCRLANGREQIIKKFLGIEKFVNLESISFSIRYQIRFNSRPKYIQFLVMNLINSTLNCRN